MTTPERNEIIVEHIIDSKENVATAFDLTAAFDQARRRLVRRALEQVERRLTDEHSDVLTVMNGFADEDFDRIPFLRFTIKSDAWPDGVELGLTSDGRRAREMSFGLRALPERAPELSDLVIALDKNVRARDPEPFPEWPWYYWLPHQYRHWDQRDALLMFAPSVHEARHAIPAVEFMVERFRETISVVDPWLRDTAHS